MFVSSLVTLSFAVFAFATPYKRFDALTVVISGPSGSVNSVDDLKLTATVTNTGAESVKILKYGTILDEKLLPSHLLSPRMVPRFLSLESKLVSVSLSDVDDTAFAVIPAGESVTVTHAVASLYDFASTGAGTFSFEPNTNFVVAGAQEKVTSAAIVAKVQASSGAVFVEITGDLARRELQLNKCATDICTTSAKKTFIDASYTEAKTLASVSSSYVTSKGSADSLYKSYFGSTATSKVTSILNAVANESSSSRTLSCVDTYSACSSGVIAYTLISTTNIYFCSIFFNEVATANLCSGTTVASRNVRGGTTLHELTHAVGGTDDVTYGCSADQALSDSNKIKNADNFNCFTTQVYQNTKC